LRLFVFREQQVVGLIPCFLREWNERRQMTLIGSGISDYLDPLLAEGHEHNIISCLGDLLGRADDWDRCDWQDLAFGTPLANFSCFDVTKQEQTICSEVRLPGAFEDFWAARPRHLRRNLRRYGAKAREQSSLRVEVTTAADESVVHALIRLHTSRWQALGESGMIQANHSACFLRNIISRFAGSDLLRIFSMRCGENIVAIILAFAFRGTMYGYLTGSDPAFKRFSVASILLQAALRYCCHEGIRAWNFRRDDEPYKTDWGAEAIRRCRIVLEHKVP
jgi:CelD/BcsL family acetyltransferase involved in cellulose biosynthesis